MFLEKFVSICCALISIPSSLQAFFLDDEIHKRLRFINSHTHTHTNCPNSMLLNYGWLPRILEVKGQQQEWEEPDGCCGVETSRAVAIEIR